MTQMISIAPMIQWTDRHYRYMIRHITKKTRLYTEMVMDAPLLHNQSMEKLEPFIGLDRELEPPITVQLGGRDPDTLAVAASLCEQFGGYDEINLNAGCPSTKAKRGGFGAELMLDPEVVRQIVYSMRRQTSSVNITVKCRLGVTGRDSWEDLVEFVNAVKAGGVNNMIIHARTCVLKGLSPAQNRTIPPLRYHVVMDLVRTFPDIQFTLNGGVKTLEHAQELLAQGVETCEGPRHLAGVMIGREAYNNPWVLADADERFFQCRGPGLSRREVLDAYLHYCARAQDSGLHGSATANIVKPLHNFFAGCATNRLYKQKLDGLVKLYSTSSRSVAEIVEMAIEDTIPDSFLESKVCERQLRDSALEDDEPS